LEIYPEDGMLYLQRRIMLTKSVSKINGEMVNGQILKEVASVLLDMHGQHEHQSLLKKQKHFEILNEYCGEEMAILMGEMHKLYKEKKELEAELEGASALEANRDKEISLAEYECKEIEEAALQPGEDEKLEKDYQWMNHARKIAEAVGIAKNFIGGMDMENASLMTDRALKELHSVSQYDESLAIVIQNLTAAGELLSEVSHSLGSYMDKMEFSEADFRAVEDRLNVLNHLKNKYGNSLEEVLAYLDERQAFLQKMEDIDVYRKDLLEKLTNIDKRLLAKCRQASKLRKEAAKKLSKEMTEALLDLNFLDVSFEICVTEDETKMTGTGYDDVEFMISLNPGEALKPLGNVASGGELSRIMLALKTVLADSDAIETLIFDEIDSGISGKSAWKVSEKLAVLGREHQVICITHLAQIAAMADTHFVIQKSATSDVTTTGVNKLNREEMIGEIARLIGSDTLTDAVLNNAKELKEQADEVKR